MGRRARPKNVLYPGTKLLNQNEFHKCMTKQTNQADSSNQQTNNQTTPKHCLWLRQYGTYTRTREVKIRGKNSKRSRSTDQPRYNQRRIHSKTTSSTSKQASTGPAGRKAQLVHLTHSHKHQGKLR